MKAETYGIFLPTTVLMMAHPPLVYQPEMMVRQFPVGLYTRVYRAISFVIYSTVPVMFVKMYRYIMNFEGIS